MNFEGARRQVEAVISRGIRSGVSVQQNQPLIDEIGNLKTIGDLSNTAVALKNIPYSDIYLELNVNNQFHMKLPDGGLLIFQYKFENDQLVKHRLCFFPSPSLPTTEEAPDLYERDQLYGDILQNRIVRFPIRFDYDPGNYKVKIHPHSHLTLGQFENCRIPVNSPVSPINFFRFILRNFYYSLYHRHQNIFEKNIASCKHNACITKHETSLAHFVF